MRSSSSSRATSCRPFRRTGAEQRPHRLLGALDARPGRARRHHPARGVDARVGLGHHSQAEPPTPHRTPWPPWSTLCRPVSGNHVLHGRAAAIHNASDLVEAMVAHLDGQRFDAPTRLGSELTRKPTKWVAPTVGLSSTKLVVELQPPDDIGAWHLSVLGADPDGHLVPVEVAIVDHPKLVEQLERIERLLPALKRPGAARRGQVILSQDEAWELMSTTGPTLAAVGFDVRVPAVSRQARHPVAATDRGEHGRPGRGRPAARQRGLVGAVRRRRAERGGDRRADQAGTTTRAVARPVDRARQSRPRRSRSGLGRARRHHTAERR